MKDYIAVPLIWMRSFPAATKNTPNCQKIPPGADF